MFGGGGGGGWILWIELLKVVDVFFKLLASVLITYVKVAYSFAISFIDLFVDKKTN